VLVKRIGVGGDFHPLSTAGDHRQHRRPRSDHPHVVLQLGHIFLGGGLLRERPWQHEFGFEDRAGRLDPAVQGGAHPSDRWVPDLSLDVRDGLTGIRAEPAAIELLGNQAKLNEEIAREIFRFSLATFLAP
jgi:hypothetical protein